MSHSTLEKCPYPDITTLGSFSEMMSIGNEQLTEISDNDCCGNGCANCILDVNPCNSHRVDKTGKNNIILNYGKYKLLQKVPHHPILQNILELHFAYATLSKPADCILDIPPGHHLMMRAPRIDNAETKETKYVCRPYSPYWVDAINLEFKILVNLKPNGPMSQFIMRMLEGDEVEFRGPIGNMELEEKIVSSQSYLIITQGVAIAPTLPVIEHLLGDEENVGRIFYFGCFQDLNHVYFRERLHGYNKYWNFKGCIYLSHQNCAAQECTDQCEHFKKLLRYKEPVFRRRFDVKELEEVCRGMGGIEKMFIISGTRQFQESFAEAIKKMEVYNDGDKLFML